ncbi:retron Ec78 anti-phage system effector HNH endonuclease PtuB [Thiothrix sp.]|jgi:uncharacterized protein (TIGR02646 family)|uniref:retron Ec78 anti-phage system effector HNH endonuclease PtuB n=1 Tax=Thiothrix sp. TaxID=1032 RepID=UPI00257ABD39|nr:retron Ec78 anti-phage system effector HNH endonuclease PtuB [Thiothrix sp.]
MKNITKGAQPDKLLNYQQQNPNNDWDQFRRKKPSYQQVKQQLLTDQGGLCAYCEIDLKQATHTTDKDDFRVEHFHPKSDHTTEHNWNLDWNNLLGCCHGGSRADVAEANLRFTSPDHSCDIPKGNHDWDNHILNPLHLPAFPAVFSFSRSDGAMSVQEMNCLSAGIDENKAQQTIDLLHLDIAAGRLRRLRKATLDAINASLQNELKKGVSVQEARIKLAQRLLRRNADDHWPRFFSAIRSYLGEAAEEQLKAINYQG